MKAAPLSLVIGLAFGTIACGGDQAVGCPTVEPDAAGNWTTVDGCAVPSSELRSHPGPEECGWTLVDYLVTDIGTYHWDPVNFLAYVDGQTRNRTLKADSLPAGVVDTGYRRGTEELWLDPDDDQYAYVVAGTFAERYLLDRDGVIVSASCGSRPQ